MMEEIIIDEKSLQAVLKRCDYLEQENKELKTELQKFQDMAKKGLDEFKDVGGCWGCGLQLQLNQDMEDIKQLKAENKELKKENETLNYQWQKQSEIGDEWYNIAENYRSALEEIRAIINQPCDNCKYNKDGITCSIGDCGEGKLKIIENKINEVLDVKY